jgi:uncharacterized protein
MRQASTMIRVLLAALVVIVLGGLAITLVQLTDTALSIQERLQRLPAWAAYPLAAMLLGIGVALGYLVWRLLRPVRVTPALPQVISRDAVAARIAAFDAKQSSASQPALVQPDGRTPLTAALHAELTELDRRASAPTLYLALFGEISTGKTSLIQALGGTLVTADAYADTPQQLEFQVLPEQNKFEFQVLPKQNDAIHVTGGTTTHAVHYRAQLSELSPALILADVPGTNEANAAQRAVLAREEALRAHVVALVVTGDLSRVQAEEWRWLVAFEKPVWLILNKIDRYPTDELAQLLQRLREKFGTDAIPVSAGFTENITVIDAAGAQSQRSRQRPAQLAPLHARLVALAHSSKLALEPARARAVLNAMDLKLSDIEHTQRLEEGQALVKRYTQRAMLGAMASVAPGSDVVIQGALAFGLVRSLTELYGMSMTKLDIDDLLKLLGGKLKGSITLLLAIAGNAAKAFPGLGTLGGGALHAMAYGLLFESVGKALLECLDRQLLDARGGIDRLTLLSRLQSELGNHRQLIQRAAQLARDMLASR